MNSTSTALNLGSTVLTSEDCPKIKWGDIWSASHTPGTLWVFVSLLLLRAFTCRAARSFPQVQMVLWYKIFYQFQGRENPGQTGLNNKCIYGSCTCNVGFRQVLNKQCHVDTALSVSPLCLPVSASYSELQWLSATSAHPSCSSKMDSSSRQIPCHPTLSVGERAPPLLNHHPRNIHYCMRTTHRLTPAIKGMGNVPPQLQLRGVERYTNLRDEDTIGKNKTNGWRDYQSPTRTGSKV